jgi:hypothetical protein
MLDQVHRVGQKPTMSICQFSDYHDQAHCSSRLAFGASQLRVGFRA